jgi:hypothetical protein
VSQALPAAVLAIAAVILPAGAAEIASPALIRDFMIQNACLDSRGAVVDGASPIDGDPRCVAQRDLRPGEKLPYHKHDHPALHDASGLPRGYQRHDSFPVETAGFGTVVEHSFDFGAGEGRRFGVFDAGKGDGGDIALLSGDDVSIAATEDGGAGFQLFVGPHCAEPVGAPALAGSWIIADLTPSAPLQGDTVARLKSLREGSQTSCPAHLNAAFTRWQVRDVRYRAAPGQGTPVTLESLVSEHYGGADPATADHVERFYFTRELGATRWERWQNTAKSHGLFEAVFGAGRATQAAADIAASGRCSAADPPPGGAPMVIVDCREWTRIVRPDRGGGDPPAFFIDAIRARGLGAGLFAAPDQRSPR